jgi:nucleoside-diphosphate-sugar epimerase
MIMNQTIVYNGSILNRAMKKYLVTGVTGFLGKKLANELLLSGHYVIGIGRKSSHQLPKELLENMSFSYFQLSLTNDDISVFDSIKIDGVYHLASRILSEDINDFKKINDDNVYATFNLLNYFKNRTLDFFVYTSTNSIFSNSLETPINEQTVPNPGNYYGLTKYFAEQLIFMESKKMNTKCIVFRFSSIFGKDDNFGLVNALTKSAKLNQKIELYSNYNKFRSLIPDIDVLTVLVSVTKKYKNLGPFELFEIGGSESLTTLEIVNLIKQELNSMSEIELSNKITQFDWDIFVDSSLAKHKLGFRPSPLKESIIFYLNQSKNEL